MNPKKINLLSWNCHGLGSLDKCLVVRNVIKKSRWDVCCLQETKWNDYNLLYYMTMFPSYFDRSSAYISEKNTKGGCVITSRNNFKLINSWSTKHIVTVILEQASTGAIMAISNIYGPSIDDQKIEFISELNILSLLINCPWILAGDFNLVRWYIDRSGDMRGIILLNLFNNLIRDQGWIDVELKNRSFTWINKRPSPTLSKIDRIFISSKWQSMFPLISLQALSMVVSDHVPLLLTFRHHRTKPRTRRLENYWFQYSEAHQIIQTIWEQPSGEIADFQQKLTVCTANWGNGTQTNSLKWTRNWMLVTRRFYSLIRLKRRGTSMPGNSI